VTIVRPPDKVGLCFDAVSEVQLWQGVREGRGIARDPRDRDFLPYSAKVADRILGVDPGRDSTYGERVHGDGLLGR
jgi:hypothetical protein